MEVPSRLVVVRHGESLVQRLKKGSRFFPDRSSRDAILPMTDRDIPLMVRGLRHAERTGELLYARFGAFDVLAQSTFRRNQQTANALVRPYSRLELRRLEVITSPDLDERDYGYTFAMTEEEVAEEYPWLSEYWEIKKEVNARFPGGNSLADMIPRVRGFLDERLPQWAGRNVLISGHWGTVLAIRACLEGLDEAGLLEAMSYGQPANCSLTVYESHESGALKLSEKNLLLCEAEGEAA